MAKLSKALIIARSSLRACYDKKGIVAGRTHYNYYWARDSFYASWGAIELKDYDVVRRNLELFLKNIRKDGHVPIRVGASGLGQWLALAGIKAGREKPRYSQDKGFNPAIDPNLLLLITLDKYVSRTNDAKIAKSHLPKVRACIGWLEKREKQGLLWCGRYSTWQDIVKKKGFVLYTNILYCKALASLSSVLKKIGVSNEFLEKAKIVKNRINESFWDKKKGHYIDFFDDKKRSAVFSSDGNFLAVLFGIAERKKAESILKKADELGISKDAPSLTNIPEYGFGEVYTPLYLIGMQDYNNGTCWPWLGCLHSMALAVAGEKRKAGEVLEKLARLIIRDDDAYEIYEPDGRVVKRLFYTSEHPFAWSASFYILAHSLLKKRTLN